jgi:hypothetical protein
VHTCDESEEIHLNLDHKLKLDHKLDHKRDVISTDAERRAWARVPTDDAARMKVLQPPGAKAAEVRILDVSQGGLKLRVPANLPPGTIVQIDLKSAVVRAEVRYCVRAELGFHAGVQLQHVAWTSDAAG